MKFFQYKEIKQHGSPSFPVQYYYVDNSHPHYVMPLHWHDSFEIIVVKKGTLRLYLNNEAYVGEPGAVFFVNPSTLHRAEPIDCIYECAVFDMKLIENYDTSRISEYIQPIASLSLEVSPICDSVNDTVKELFAVLSVEREFYELQAISILYKLFYELYNSECIKKIKKKSKSYIHRRAQMVLLLEEIGREFTGKISFAELSEFCGIDEKYLFRVFKEFTGCTPTDYINRIRIDHACYLMTVRSLTATEASLECGFNELSYFSRVFKKYKGMSPGQYRRSISERGYE